MSDETRDCNVVGAWRSDIGQDLKPGDTVRIFHREQPYNEKIFLLQALLDGLVGAWLLRKD